jgi:hypothetical protein
MISAGGSSGARVSWSGRLVGGDGVVGYLRGVCAHPQMASVRPEATCGGLPTCSHEQSY